MKKYTIIVYPDKRAQRPVRSADIATNNSIKEYIQTEFSQWRILIWTDNYFVLCNNNGVNIRVSYYEKRRINSHENN